MLSEAAFRQQEIAEMLEVLPAIVTYISVLIIELIFVEKKRLGKNLAKKIQKAEAAGQVVTAKLDSNKYQTRKQKYVHARYIYSLDGIHKKAKVISIYSNGNFIQIPDRIKIYYLGNRIYTHYDTDAKPQICFLLIPFLLALAVQAIVHPEMFIR